MPQKFEYQNAKVYFRDGLVDFNEANVSIASSPVLYGLAIYTVFNVTWDAANKKLHIFRLADHFERLCNSAKIMDFDGFCREWTYEKFQQTMTELLIANRIEEDVLVRVSVFIDELVAGTKIRGLTNSVSAYAYPMGEILPRTGVNLCVSSWMRNPDNSIPSRAKVNGSYINASLMKNEALLNGYDDAIAIDEHGHVAESTVANLFLVRGGKLITPGQATDILEGITRSTILTLAADLGIDSLERSVDRSELYICDEMFLCGSSARITPVLSVDRRAVGDGRIGPVTKKLMASYENAQRGVDEAYPGWLLSVQP
jgi:branched-chain amino acid aminotransferase